MTTLAPSQRLLDSSAALSYDPATEALPMSTRIAPHHARLAAQAVPDRRTRAAHIQRSGFPAVLLFKGAAVQSETLKEAKNWI